jgi:AmmeMemoRadiSam system protein A
MCSLHDSDRRALLSIARQALVEAAEHRREAAIPIVPEALRPPAGAFVTLWKRKKLRGCIGQVEATEPLARVVAHCAYGAALEDPRFEPVAPAELPELEIEISVLSAPFRIAPLQATAQVKLGEHGLIISLGNYRGVLLPRVAVEQGWTAERLLDETSIKAGLSRDAWRDPNSRIEAFTAEVFGESGFAGSAAGSGT